MPTFRKSRFAVERPLLRHTNVPIFDRDSCLCNPISRRHSLHHHSSRPSHSPQPASLLSPPSLRHLFRLQNAVLGTIHEKCGLGACAAEEIYCKSGIIGPDFPDFSVNRTTIRLKIDKIWPRFSTFSLRSLLPRRLLAPEGSMLRPGPGNGLGDAHPIEPERTLRFLI